MPSPPFSEFSALGLTFHIYGLIIGLAIIAAILIYERTIQAVGYQREDASKLVLPTVIAGIIGGRLFHVFSEPVRYFNNPEDIIAIWNGGLGIYGAVWLGGAVMIWRAKAMGLNPWKAADALAPAVVIAQAIGRWGNYFNEELFGRETDLPWALDVSFLQTDHHPTFLYESLANLTIGLSLLYILFRVTNRPTGFILASYFAMYSAVRFVMEQLRIDEAHMFFGMRQNAWVALAVFLVSAYVAVYLWVRYRRQGAGSEKYPEIIKGE